MNKLKLVGQVLLCSLLILFIANPAHALAPRYNSRIIYRDFTQSTGTSDIYSMNSDGSDKRVILAGSDELNIYYSQVSPDGQTVVFSTTNSTVDPNQSGYSLVDADGQNVHSLVSIGNNYPGVINWSPDGTKLVYLVYDADTFARTIHTINADGTDDTLVTVENTDADSQINSVAMSSDKFALALDGHLYVANLDGTNSTDLSSEAGWTDASVSAVAWSPDGTKLVFIAYDCPGGGQCIATANSDGSDKHIVTADPDVSNACDGAAYRKAEFSPDGTKILFDNTETCG
jgi:Tol biopolymer transport system component